MHTFESPFFSLLGLLIIGRHFSARRGGALEYVRDLRLLFSYILSHSPRNAPSWKPCAAPIPRLQWISLGPCPRRPPPNSGNFPLDSPSGVEENSAPGGRSVD